MFGEPWSAIGALLERAQRAIQEDLPGLISAAATSLGALEAVVYLADLQETQLTPFVGSPRPETMAEPLAIDGTLAGRAFQHGSVLPHHSRGRSSGSTVRVWVPLSDGSERLGVLALSFPAEVADEAAAQDATLRFAELVAQLVMTKTLYGDHIVRLRRRMPMSLAAELQWSLLPPSTFASDDVAISGALEPAYRVAGDLFDYAVDGQMVRAAIADGMGHSLRSSQLAALIAAGYRFARRSRLSLPDTVQAIDDALMEVFGGSAFATGVFVELDPRSGLLSWVNTGHPPPLLIRDSRVVGPLTRRPRPPLGVRLPEAFAMQDSRVDHEQLEPGDRVLMFTDGVIEARTPDGEFFGEQRLIDSLTRSLADGLSDAESLRRLVHAVLGHQQGQLDDDATLLMLSWRRADLLQPLTST